MVRAYYPWPVAWTTWNGKILKILELETELFETRYPKFAIAEFRVQSAGYILLYNGNAAVKCDKKILIIKKLQLEGGKILSAQEFLNGHKDFIGSVLK